MALGSRGAPGGVRGPRAGPSISVVPPAPVGVGPGARAADRRLHRYPAGPGLDSTDRWSRCRGGHAKSSGHAGCWVKSIRRREGACRGVRHVGRDRETNHASPPHAQISTAPGQELCLVCGESSPRTDIHHPTPSAAPLRRARKDRGMTSFAVQTPRTTDAVPAATPSYRWRLGTLLLSFCLVFLAGLSPAGADGEASGGGGGRWRWPVPPPHPIVQPFEAPSHRYGPGHRGIDIAAPLGATVTAVEDGTVHFAGMVAGRGVVSVRHHDGLLSTYEPVEASVAAGQSVRAGDALGTLSTQAGSLPHCPEGPCLHLGARRGKDEYIDPAPLLSAAGPSVLLPWRGGAASGNSFGGGRSADAVQAARATHESRIHGAAAYLVSSGMTSASSWDGMPGAPRTPHTILPFNHRFSR